jgi:hypothetical protein
VPVHHSEEQLIETLYPHILRGLFLAAGNFVCMFNACEADHVKLGWGLFDNIMLDLGIYDWKKRTC